VASQSGSQVHTFSGATSQVNTFQNSSAGSCIGNGHGPRDEHIRKPRFVMKGLGVWCALSRRTAPETLTWLQSIRVPKSKSSQERYDQPL
jgi:hypothetical protein